MWNRKGTTAPLLRAVQSVPWTRLAHARGVARDAPKHLKVFLEAQTTTRALERATDWLDDSVLHQGNLYSATPPVIWILLELTTARPNHPGCVAVLHSVETVTHGLKMNDQAGMPETGAPSEDPFGCGGRGEPLYEVWVQEGRATRRHRGLPLEGQQFTGFVRGRLLRELVRHAIPVIQRALRSDENAVRAAAVSAGLGALQVIPTSAEPLQALLHSVGDPSHDPGTWIAVALASRELGHDLTHLLVHEDRRVRLAATMSAGPGTELACTAELASALLDCEWLDREFLPGSASLRANPRNLVLWRLLEVADPGSADTIVIEALCETILTRASLYTVDLNWGPVLRWGFADRLTSQPPWAIDPALPTELTRAQAAILRCLCSRVALWDRRYANASLAFADVQLPYNRAVLSRLLRATDPLEE